MHTCTRLIYIACILHGMYTVKEPALWIRASLEPQMNADKRGWEENQPRRHGGHGAQDEEVDIACWLLDIASALAPHFDIRHSAFDIRHSRLDCRPPCPARLQSAGGLWRLETFVWRAPRRSRAAWKVKSLTGPSTGIPGHICAGGTLGRAGPRSCRIRPLCASDFSDS